MQKLSEIAAIIETVSGTNKTKPNTKSVSVRGINDFAFNFFRSSVFHFKAGAIPANNNRGMAIGLNTELKYGAPTATESSVKTSITIGYIVPKKTIKHKTTSRRLFIKIAPSFEMGVNVFLGFNLCALNAKSVSETPITSPKNRNI